MGWFQLLILSALSGIHFQSRHEAVLRYSIYAKLPTFRQHPQGLRSRHCCAIGPSDNGDGHSNIPDGTFRCLNDEAIPGPGNGIWKDTTIRRQSDRGTGVLNNEAYIGRLVYGRTQYKKNPKTGRRVSRPQPEENWAVNQVLELRIMMMSCGNV